MDTLKTAASASDALREIRFDPSLIGTDSWVIIFLGYIIVFLALVGLSIFMIYFSKLLKVNLRKRLAASGHETSEDDSELDISGEVNAAIALALHKHFEEVHDFENTVITIQKVQRPYSPWSSKIYGLRHNPRN